MRRGWAGHAALVSFVLASAGCAMAGFGGSLELNITGQQTRAVVIAIDAGAADARVYEIDATGEIELGTGRATIERYVLQRASLGSDAAIGFFLCPKPCTDPLRSYVVAYSPEQVFTANGELQLHFRIVNAEGTAQEVTRTIRADMLPALWESPRIEASASGG
jgi:hypothetical protein